MKTNHVANVTHWSTDDQEFIQLNGRVQISRRNQYNYQRWKAYTRISAHSIARLKRAAAARIEAGQWGEVKTWCDLAGSEWWIAGENYLPLPEKKKVKMPSGMDPHYWRKRAMQDDAKRKQKKTA